MKGDDFFHGPQQSAQFLEVVGSNPSCFLCFYLFIFLYLTLSLRSVSLNRSLKKDGPTPNVQKLLVSNGLVT